MKKFMLLAAMLITAITISAQEIPASLLFVGVVNESSDIYLWLPEENGGRAVNLSNTPQKEGNACWWQRKELILASREQQNGNYSLVALDSQGKTVWELTDPFGSLGWPVPSPFDDRILCVRALSDGFVQTGIVNYPDGGFEPFEFEGLAGGQLAWLNPDLIMLSRVTSEGFTINHRELSSGNEQIIVRGGQNWQSHVNATTGRMFFVRRVGQNGSIFELFKDASGHWEYENITNGSMYDWQPSTSSDGGTLIYRSLRDGRFETIIRDLATGREKQIAMPGFAQIYFPTILDQAACTTLQQQIR